ncbi:hypothetical protein [Bernardetia sp.]|uniref:hypothetical protein n=1 Tax=Bernardetia sp. TaxID=1937974 RepID=UPI0025C5AACA|nr:hypothetical protein [Bernardetia sp.]
MKRILFPLLALLVVAATYAYMRTETYNFSEKDLRVIHDADRIALQMVAEKRVQNNVFIEKVKNYLDKNGKDQVSINLLQRVRQIQTLSSDLLQKSNDIRAQWLQNPNEQPTDLLIEFAKAQKEYISKLQRFTETTSEVIQPLFSLPLENSNDVGQEISEADFAAYFEKLPMSVRLYTLTSINAAIANSETKTIYYISQQIEYPIFEINDLVGIVAPSEIILLEGNMYEATMKVVGVSSFTKPQLEIDQAEGYEELKTVEKNGIVSLSFVAKADDYNERGLAYKTWKGNVTIQLPNGKDSTFTIQENYIVRKSRNGILDSPTPTELNPNESKVIYEEPSSIE